jgi:hypothetical protein
MSEKLKQSKGGTARAKSLTKEERSAIAKKASAARWDWPCATHDGPLQIGDVTLDCAVLENGTRVISQTKFMEAMGIYYSGWLAKARSEDKATADLPLHLPYKGLIPFVDKHFGGLQVDVVNYRTKSGSIAKGIQAEILPKVCEVWLDARNAGVLTGSRQIQIAEKADILIRGFAHVGVVALVDEATGYQYERQRDALQELLEEFLTDSLRRWVKTFPNAYFKEMCRLRGVSYRSDMKLPPYFGHLTNDVVYKRLAPGVLNELQSRNPNEDGRRKSKHFQWLSDNVGHPKLLQHLGTVVGLMKISPDWDTFKNHLDIAAPVMEEAPLFAELQGKD